MKPTNVNIKTIMIEGPPLLRGQIGHSKEKANPFENVHLFIFPQKHPEKKGGWAGRKTIIKRKNGKQSVTVRPEKTTLPATTPTLIRSHSTGISSPFPHFTLHRKP